MSKPEAVGISEKSVFGFECNGAKYAVVVDHDELLIRMDPIEDAREDEAMLMAAALQRAATKLVDLRLQYEEERDRQESKPCECPQPEMPPMRTSFVGANTKVMS